MLLRNGRVVDPSQALDALRDIRITAGLIGLVLATMEKRPVLSGLLLGLLTYKPQFGLLFPLVLLISGRWKVFAFAAVSALGLLALSAVVFGAGTLAAFLHVLPEAGQTLITNGAVGWGKLQSLYGLTRCLGGSDLAGWTLQGLMSAACAVGVALVWRSQAPFALKAAAEITRCGGVHHGQRYRLRRGLGQECRGVF